MTPLPLRTNVLFLDVEFRRIRKMLEESWPQRVDAQAAQASKSAAEQAYAKTYAQRREPNDAA